MSIPTNASFWRSATVDLLKLVRLHPIFIIISLYWTTACSEPQKPPASNEATIKRTVEPTDLTTRADGLQYFKDESTPFSGVAKTHHPNGNLWKELPYLAGQPNAQWRVWYPNGKPKILWNYVNGTREGESAEWYENGKKRWKATFLNGKPHGNWDQWDETGLHTEHREYSNGKIVREEITRALTKQIEQISRKRQKLDETIWKEEVAAQKAEEVFVELWDQLRAAEDKFTPFERLPVTSLVMPKTESTRQVEWNILEHKMKRGEKILDSQSWLAWLKAKKTTGWKIVETEWHQQRFKLHPEGTAESIFNFVIHAHLKERRAILRGELKVNWKTHNPDNDSEFTLGPMEINSLVAFERTGARPFRFNSLIKSNNEINQTLAPTLVKDFNGDGLPEIVLPGVNELHWNLGGWKFDRQKLFKFFPVPLAVGVIGDFTGDGLDDLLAAPKEGFPMLYVTDSKGKFDLQPRPIKVPVNKLLGHSACSAGDVDGDGDLDAWVMQYKAPYQGGQFPDPYYDANDGYPSYLLINDGKGNFTEGTKDAGLGDKRFRRTYSGSLVDLDNDGDLDLMNVSDFSGLDLYINDGKGKFDNITEELGEQRFTFGMSHVIGDFNGDALLDFYVTGMGSTTARRMEAMKAGRDEYEAHQSHRMKMGYGNRLFLGGKSGFNQASYNDQVARAGWSWGTSGADFDLDGDRDIFVANGHLSRKSAKDYCTAFWRHDIYSGSSKNNTIMDAFYVKSHGTLDSETSWNGFEHNVFYLNIPGEGFVNVAFLMGVSHEFDSRIVASPDLNADGLPDIIVAEVQADEKWVLHLIENNWKTAGNWVGIQLRGESGTSPLGAVVSVKSGGRIWSQPVVSGDSFATQHPSIIHFGLGNKTHIDSITVQWTGGVKSIINEPKSNQYHLIRPN